MNDSPLAYRMGRSTSNLSSSTSARECLLFVLFPSITLFVAYPEVVVSPLGGFDRWLWAFHLRLLPRHHLPPGLSKPFTFFLCTRCFRLLCHSSAIHHPSSVLLPFSISISFSLTQADVELPLISFTEMLTLAFSFQARSTRASYASSSSRMTSLAGRLIPDRVARPRLTCRCFIYQSTPRYRRITCMLFRQSR